MAVMFSIGLVFATWRYFHPVDSRLEYLWGSVLGGFFFGFSVALFLLVSRMVYDWVLHRFGKESQILVGGGDIKLIAVMSFFFPANAYTLNLFLAFALLLIGLVVQWLIGRKQVVPFAPYMFVASVVVTVFGVWNTLRVV